VREGEREKERGREGEEREADPSPPVILWGFFLR
jgi:hypothetical protein